MNFALSFFNVSTLVNMNYTHPLQQINFATPNQAVVIEASAGTGKTWTIERLFIKALLEATIEGEPPLPVTIKQILVVTFTNDATNELKERLQQQLQATINFLIAIYNKIAIPDDFAHDLFYNYLSERRHQYEISKDITLLNHALQGFDQAAIFTIHGFCHRVLHDFQFALEAPANFELVSNKQQIIVELVTDFLRTEIIAKVENTAALEQILFNIEALFTSYDFDLTLAEKIVARLPRDLFYWQLASYQLKYQLAATASLALLYESELSAEQKVEARAQFLAAVINYLVNKYPLKNENLQQLSYDELIQLVADGVEHHPQLAELLYQRYPIAFIDEFQDTDSLQWQIFKGIYQLAGAKRGNVVVVGDPKQAIYRFRGADVATYLQAKLQIGTSLHLAENFRSHPQIMNFINQLFDEQHQIANLSFLGSGIEYCPVQPRGGNGNCLPSAAELNNLLQAHGIDYTTYADPVQIVAVSGAKKAQRSDNVLAHMTMEILALLKWDSRLKGKIAILVTKNREAVEVVNYLRRYGIKASELKLGNIFATDTAYDLYEILTAISDLSQRNNLKRALATRLFNLPLCQLFTAADSNNLETIYRQFYGYRDIWQRRGVISLVYTLIEDICQLNATQSSLFSYREIANLWQLAELINKQAQLITSHSELMHWFLFKIKQATKAGGTELEANAEELVRLDNDDQQIIITTQHKAKGLEYEILFCPFFRSNAEVDGNYEVNYQRPFFSSYRDQEEARSELICDKALAQAVVAQDNKEIHRLNYVALTRAKSRLYIYLKQPSLTLNKKYAAYDKPDKLVELMGYVRTNPADDSHPLFNYPAFFSREPHFAIKRPELLPGVRVVASAGVSASVMTTLSEQLTRAQTNSEPLPAPPAARVPLLAYRRQSYSSLSIGGHSESGQATDYYVAQEVAPEASPSYRYSILNDSGLRGPAFGLLFHDLCEKYPFSQQELMRSAAKVSLDLKAKPEYIHQLQAMLDEAFNFRLWSDFTLKSCHFSQHELEFNLKLKRGVDMNQQLRQLLSDYFGINHPFTLAAHELGRIEPGFLVGFIDLFFEYQGQYWVLDYKTNRVANYASPQDCFASDNEIINSMAEHHYYLQYLLYLVAVKRYLEQRLSIADASPLLGGALYFYVRGIYVTGDTSQNGVYCDSGCQQLVAKLDKLLAGVTND